MSPMYLVLRGPCIECVQVTFRDFDRCLINQCLLLPIDVDKNRINTITMFNTGSKDPLPKRDETEGLQCGNTRGSHYHCHVFT